jgi:hypothetical protein
VKNVYFLRLGGDGGKIVGVYEDADEAMKDAESAIHACVETERWQGGGGRVKVDALEYTVEGRYVIEKRDDA